MIHNIINPYIRENNKIVLKLKDVLRLRMTYLGHFLL